jgi:hypothetical protein
MSEKTYIWEGGARFSVPASQVGQLIEEIESAKGVCKPEDLVEKSRPKSAPTHKMFEWDDGAAASRWRNHQARNIIRQVRVVTAEVPEPSLAFVKVNTDKSETGYMSTVKALTSDRRDQVLQDALAQLNGVRKRYNNLQELADVWAALDSVGVAA